MKHLARLALLPALVLMLGATAFTAPVAAQSTGQTPRERCGQLIAYFDRFGASRTLNSDGRRNQTRLAAEVDCSRGHYDKGIAEMEALLKRKKFTPPPPGPDEDEDYN
jgi:hypothetical protein